MVEWIRQHVSPILLWAVGTTIFLLLAGSGNATRPHGMWRSLVEIILFLIAWQAILLILWTP